MLTRWEPFREMRRMHDMLDRVMDDSMSGRTNGGWYEGLAPIDVYQTADEVVIEAAMPGVKPDDIEISVTGDTLTLRGEIRQEKEVEGERDYHVRERRYRRFARSLTLPSTVDSSKAQAEIENGILTLRIPKAEAAKPRQITVKAKKG
ncbi:MAG TPA: Hsp20/alpha crystallin family protein [Anaerolineales bacterium]|jgi:HSP20 family protein